MSLPRYKASCIDSLVVDGMFAPAYILNADGFTISMLTDSQKVSLPRLTLENLQDDKCLDALEKTLECRTHQNGYILLAVTYPSPEDQVSVSYVAFVPSIQMWETLQTMGIQAIQSEPKTRTFELAANAELSILPLLNATHPKYAFYQYEHGLTRVVHKRSGLEKYIQTTLLLKTRQSTMDEVFYDASSDNSHFVTSMEEISANVAHEIREQEDRKIMGILDKLKTPESPKTELSPLEVMWHNQQPLSVSDLSSLWETAPDVSNIFQVSTGKGAQLCLDCPEQLRFHNQIKDPNSERSLTWNDPEHTFVVAKRTLLNGPYRWHDAAYRPEIIWQHLQIGNRAGKTDIATHIFLENEFHEYKAQQRIHASLYLLDTSRVVSHTFLPGDIVKYDGSTIKFKDGSEYKTQWLQTAIQRGWFVPLFRSWQAIREGRTGESTFCQLEFNTEFLELPKTSENQPNFEYLQERSSGVLVRQKATGVEKWVPLPMAGNLQEAFYDADPIWVPEEYDD